MTAEVLANEPVTAGPVVEVARIDAETVMTALNAANPGPYGCFLLHEGTV